MGLTVHYSVQSRLRNEDKVRELIRQSHELAKQFPFEKVHRIRELGQHELQAYFDWIHSERRKLSRRFQNYPLAVLGSADIPWRKGASLSIVATRYIGFDIDVGPGCEWLTVGLCCWPREVTHRWRPRDDKRFYNYRKDYISGRVEPHWSAAKWDRWVAQRGLAGYVHQYQSDLEEDRSFPTGRPNWSFREFCKTQYANDPRAGGAANFLKCHISVVTLLEQMQQLPGWKLDFEDEGNYGPHTYCDNWQDVPYEQREYTWHPATHSIPVLLKELGDYDRMIAALGGAMRDAMQGTGSELELETAMDGRPDFERLEFEGVTAEHMQPFLREMAKLAKDTAAKASQEKIA